MLLNSLKYPERDLSLSQGKQLPFSHFTVSHVASVFNNLAPTPWRCAVSRFPRPALSQAWNSFVLFCLSSFSQGRAPWKLEYAHGPVARTPAGRLGHPSADSPRKEWLPPAKRYYVGEGRGMLM